MYGLLAIALAGGLALGFALRGRPDGLRLTRIRWWALLLAAAALSFSPAVSHAWPVGVAAGVALAAVAARNFRHFASVAVLSTGMLLNVAPLAADGGMPVSVRALACARGWPLARAAAYHLGGRHHLERASDRFTALDDRIAVPAFHSVMSIGDVLICVGLGALVLELMCRRDRTNGQARRPGYGRRSRVHPTVGKGVSSAGRAAG